MSGNLKLVDLSYVAAENKWVLSFSDARVIEVRGTALIAKGSAMPVCHDSVRRIAFDIHDRPVKFAARIVACAEMKDVDRRTAPDPFSPPRSWDAQSDGENPPGAPC